jgi:hypothetical protein
MSLTTDLRHLTSLVGEDAGPCAGVVVPTTDLATISASRAAGQARAILRHFASFIAKTRQARATGAPNRAIFHQFAPICASHRQALRLPSFVSRC